MLIIEWLNRLPGSDGVIIFKKTTTNCNSAAEAVAEANAQWPLVGSDDHRSPDGFQVVDQDGRSIQFARFGTDRTPLPTLDPRSSFDHALGRKP